MRVLVLLTACAALAACETTNTTPPAPPPVPVVDRDASRRICDVDSLATMKASYLEQSTQITLPNRSTDEQRTSTTIDRYERATTDSAVLEKMKKFRAEVDAQYRAVVSSCRAYIECMEHNSYNEASCKSLQRRWEIAEARFAGLAVRLREISASTAPRASSSGSRPPKPSNACNNQCSQVGTVFTDCCVDNN